MFGSYQKKKKKKDVECYLYLIDKYLKHPILNSTDRVINAYQLF